MLEKVFWGVINGTLFTIWIVLVLFMVAVWIGVAYEVLLRLHVL